MMTRRRMRILYRLRTKLVGEATAMGSTRLGLSAGKRVLLDGVSAAMARGSVMTALLSTAPPSLASVTSHRRRPVDGLFPDCNAGLNGKGGRPRIRRRRQGR